APRPVPTNTAVGVARPMAQGQAMMSTETKLTRATASLLSAGERANQTRNVTIATASTPRVKYPLTKSANRAIGGRDACAFLTNAMICCRVVSEPTRRALKRKEPATLIVPLDTCEPGDFTTGRLSPVSMDS